MSDQEDSPYSSQIVEEEEDFFFDDDSDDLENELQLSQENNIDMEEKIITKDGEQSFQQLLAGPSTNKVKYQLDFNVKVVSNNQT